MAEEIRAGSKIELTETLPFNRFLSLNPGAEGIVQITTDVTALVRFKIPNTPERCEGCSCRSTLSVNAGTGEIECIGSGCGHRHGFREADLAVPLSDLKLAEELVEA